MAKWRVIGISGITCGGKTSLSEKLVQKYSGSILISQDQFYRNDDDPKHEWVDVSSTVRHQNWESMASVDWEAFTRAIQLSLDKEKPNDSALFIIEGHLIFNYKPISDLCQNKFFISLEREECFARRQQRKYLPKDPIGYFDAWVWPMFLTNKNHMLTLNNNQDIVFLDGSLNPEVLFEKVTQNLFL